VEPPPVGDADTGAAGLSAADASAAGTGIDASRHERAATLAESAAGKPKAVGGYGKRPAGLHAELGPGSSRWTAKGCDQQLASTCWDGHADMDACYLCGRQCQKHDRFARGKLFAPWIFAVAHGRCVRYGVGAPL